MRPVRCHRGMRTLREIRGWSRQMLGINCAPAIWRALAHQPKALDTTWRKDRLILSAGSVDELVKTCVAWPSRSFDRVHIRFRSSRTRWAANHTYSRLLRHRPYKCTSREKSTGCETDHRTRNCP